ncbi:MAG: N-acetyl sugar amidotransferase [Alphaproteobacteria bacterium]
MRYCRRCLYPANHPLHLTFDDEGVCSGCRVHEEKDTLDWTERELRLRALLDAYRNRSGNSYDCIVPVSGARDSYFIVDLLRRRYGLRPLLVSYNRHYNTQRGIRNLAYLRTLTDGDFVQQVLAPQTVKRIVRETLRRVGSMHWHTLAGQTVYPVQMAVRLKVPLIVWGAHQGLDQVGMYSHTDEIEMTRRYRCEHDLMGLEAEDLVDGAEGLTEDELRPLFYPHDRELQRVGVRGIYLGNYIRWDTKAQHERMLSRYAYETAQQSRTFDTYSDVDCQHYSGVHDWIKFAKWGYGKATDHACREIRLRRMTRAEGIEQVRRYADAPAPDMQRFLEWAGLDEATFRAQVDRHRDPAIWSRSSGGDWVLHDSVPSHADEAADVALAKIEDCRFLVTPSKNPAADEAAYVLLHRGWVDGAEANRLQRGQPVATGVPA